jgi:hypothetical protein
VEAPSISSRDLLKARDAYSCALALALLNVGVQLLAIAGGVGLPRVLPLPVILGDGIVSVVIVAYLIATRARPNRRVALAIGLGYVVFFVALNAYIATRAVFVGRAYEAFVAPVLLVSSFGLMAPGLRLGLAALAVFLAEGLGIYVWLRSAQPPIALIPLTQPGSLVTFAVVGASLLHLRYRRRELALKYVDSSAELLAVRRLSGAFESIASDLDRQLQTVTRALEGLSSVAAPRAQRSVDRLSQLRQQLSDLTDAPTRGAADPGEAERAFYGHDAQNGATTLAFMGMVASLSYVTTMHDFFSTRTVLAGVAVGVLALGCFCYLRATRHRPTERRGIATALVVTLPFALLPMWTQPEFIASGRAFEVLGAQKALALLFPLAVGRRRWLGLACEAALVVESAYLFYWRGLVEVSDSFSTFEPWLTLAFVLIGTGVLMVSEYRRVASVTAMRADRELAMEARRVGLQLAVLDQLGTPLQTLVVSLGALQMVSADGEQTRAMTHAVDVLSGLRERVPSLDAHTTALVSASFDGAAVLRRSY